MQMIPLQQIFRTVGKYVAYIEVVGIGAILKIYGGECFLRVVFSFKLMYFVYWCNVSARQLELFSIYFIRYVDLNNRTRQINVDFRVICSIYFS